jgi:hypothetical protein
MWNKMCPQHLVRYLLSEEESLRGTPLSSQWNAEAPIFFSYAQPEIYSKSEFIWEPCSGARGTETPNLQYEVRTWKCFNPIHESLFPCKLWRLILVLLLYRCLSNWGSQILRMEPVLSQSSLFTFATIMSEHLILVVSSCTNLFDRKLAWVYLLDSEPSFNYCINTKRVWTIMFLAMEFS